MAKFRVWAASISYCYLDVEAEDEDKAKEIAEEVDGGEFHEDCFGDWEWGDVAPLDDDAEVDYSQKDFYGEE